MDGWPEQASDAELATAERLAESLLARGLVRLADAELNDRTRPGGTDRIAAQSVYGLAHRGYLTGVVRESTAEVTVGDVTQIANEVWAPVWVEAVVYAGVRHCGLHAVHGDLAEFATLRKANTDKLATYLRGCSRRYNDPAIREAIVSVWALSRNPEAVHTILFPATTTNTATTRHR